MKINYYSDSKFWLGYVEPGDKSWILFIPLEGDPVLFTKRDPKTGAVL